MHHVPRFMLLPFFAASVSGGAWGMEGSTSTAKPAEYKRGDMNFYWKDDVVKADPTVVVVPSGSLTEKDGSYFYTPHKKAPKEIYVEVLNDWIEPITPPNATAALSIAPDAMQIREPQGDVRAALPSAPANFTPVTDGMSLPNGAVIKTGPDATAAVLFGGVASARLLPNSEAALQQTVTAQSRAVEIDLTAGGVFSKVGQQVGVTEDYEIHTPFGIAVAHGTDFVTLTNSVRTDVWVAQGTVSLEPPDSKVVETVTADGKGTLQMMRFPLIADPHLAITPDSEAITAMMNFIPMANQKIKSLRDRMKRESTLTASEQDYLHRIKEVPVLMKLALVEKTPPPKPIAPVAVVREPAAEGGGTTAPIPAPLAPVTAAPAPVDLFVGPGDQIRPAIASMPGETALSDTDLNSRLADMAKADPNHLVVISKTKGVSQAFYKKIVDACHAVQLKVKIVHPAPAAKVATPTAPPPLPAIPATPAVVPPPPVPAVPATPPAPVVAAKPPVAPKAKPVEVAVAPVPGEPAMVVVHGNGTIKFLGLTTGLAEFQKRLKALIKTTPDQEIVIKSGAKIPYDKLKAVLDACTDAQVQHITVTSPAPSPNLVTPVAPSAPFVPQSPTNNLPAPTLLMHPSMQPATTNTPPDTSSSSTTNSTPPASP